MSLKRFGAFMCLLVMIGLFTTTTLQAQNITGTPTPPLPFDNRFDPVYVVASYYNAINLKDYVRAYNYWEREPNGRTLAQFTQGFSDTTSVETFVRLPYYSEGAAGSIYAALPTMVIAQRTNGRQQTYVGCFTARRSNVPAGNATQPDPNWWLYDAELKAVNSTDLNQLNTACELNASFTSISSTDVFDPLHLLISYFNAIALQDYARAYGYWESPFQTYNQFAQGFAQTAEVGLVVRLDFHVGAAAGSIYTSLPALVTSALRDGTQQVFAGCYIMRRSNIPVGNATQPDPTWRLYDPQITKVANLDRGLGVMLTACEA
jgi:hypothetical protein